jgi:dihydrofolate reductase
MKVTLIAAMTIDGFIGRSTTDRSFDWTSPEDKQFYVDTIKRARVVVMGLRTFQTFTRYPKGLKFVLYTTKPEEFENPKPHLIETWATKEDPRKVLQQLESEGYEEVAICGGATIYTMFLKACLVDQLDLTIEPVLFGRGVPLLSEELNTQLELVETKKLSPRTILNTYRSVDR